MNWKTLVVGVALSSAGVVGCGSPATCVSRGAEICGNMIDENCNGMADDVCTATCGDGTCEASETATSCADDCGAGMTRTYVVSTMDTGEEQPDPTMAYGFDLDGMVNGATDLPCTAAADFTSAVTGGVGVDNQLSTVLPVLGGMLPMGVNGSIQEQIQSGTLLLLFEVSGINNFTTDSDVDIRIVLGELAAGATIMTDGMGLAAGQTFASMTEVAMVTGTIAAGRLSAETATLPLSFTVMDAVITLTLRDVVIGGRINATGGFTQGEFGAVVAVSDIVTLAGMFIMGVDLATVEGLAMPDIDPGTMCSTFTTEATCLGAPCSWASASSTCSGDGEHCASISAGLGFETVAATIAP